MNSRVEEKRRALRVMKTSIYAKYTLYKPISIQKDDTQKICAIKREQVRKGDTEEVGPTTKWE